VNVVAVVLWPLEDRLSAFTETEGSFITGPTLALSPLRFTGHFPVPCNKRPSIMSPSITPLFPPEHVGTCVQASVCSACLQPCVAMHARESGAACNVSARCTAFACMNCDRNEAAQIRSAQTHDVSVANLQNASSAAVAVNASGLPLSPYKCLLTLPVYR
jgi:hypothetical protein